MHDIFISYSHIDKNIADAICSTFENRGLRCWYAPRDIQPGADWADSIIQAIEQTKVMVLVFTSHSNLSKQVLREVNNAVDSGVTIVPFRLTNEEPAAGMKYYLSTVHWLDAMNSELHSAIDDLYGLCRVLVDQMEGRQPAVQEKKPEYPELKETKPTRPYMLIGIIAVAALALVAVFFLLNRKPAEEPSAQTENSAPAVSNATSENISMDVTETYTQGNSQGNLQSGGYLASDGEWYYYRSNDRQRLYRMKADGSGAEMFVDEPVSCISVYDGYVYYYSSGVDPSIQRIKTDGGEPVKLHYGPTEDTRIVNDRIYYQDSMDGLNLYSMALDGSDVRLENNIDKAYYFCLDGTYMYYSNQEDGGYLYRVNMDGSDPVCLSDHRIEGMTIAGSKLYYNDLNTNVLTSYDLSTGEIAELANDYIYYLNVTDTGIYGHSGTYGTKLCAMQLNGLGFRTLSEEDADHVCVCGDKIFYISNNTGYIVNLDGSGKIEP